MCISGARLPGQSRKRQSPACQALARACLPAPRRTTRGAPGDSRHRPGRARLSLAAGDECRWIFERDGGSCRWWSEAPRRSGERAVDLEVMRASPGNGGALRARSDRLAVRASPTSTVARASAAGGRSRGPERRRGDDAGEKSARSRLREPAPVTMRVGVRLVRRLRERGVVLRARRAAGAVNRLATASGLRAVEAAASSPERVREHRRPIVAGSAPPARRGGGNGCRPRRAHRRLRVARANSSDGSSPGRSTGPEPTRRFPAESLPRAARHRRTGRRARRSSSGASSPTSAGSRSSRTRRSPA